MLSRFLIPKSTSACSTGIWMVFLMTSWRSLEITCGAAMCTPGSIFSQRGKELDIILYQFGVMRERLWREANALKDTSFKVFWKRVTPGLMVAVPLFIDIVEDPLCVCGHHLPHCIC